jgi:phosphoribosylformimino-5-aminoimidazole carboxamide ribotide isomerase
VYTDISRDGMQSGVNVDAYEAIAEDAGFPVIASGGISSLEDLSALAALGPDTVEGAITGRALYEGAFKLKHAIRAGRGEW